MGPTFGRLATVTATIIVGLTLGATSVWAQSITPNASPSEEDLDRARNHMAAGVAFLNDPAGKLYEEAYPEFKKAYALSGSLNALQNLANCAIALERDGEVIEYLEIVLAEVEDLAPADRAQYESDLARTKATVARVTLSADRPGVKVTDTRTPNRDSPVRNTYVVGTTPITLGIHPGSHRFTAIAEDGTERVWVKQIENGSTHEYAFSFAEPAPSEPVVTPLPDPAVAVTPRPGDGDPAGIPIPVWIAGGATVAVAIPMAVFMGLSTSRKSEFDDEILGQEPVTEQERAADELRTTNLVADVLLGVTAAGAVTTLVLALVLPSADEGDAGADTGSNPGVDYAFAPSFDPRGGGGAQFSLRF
ncbi:MAG: hypothetical protein AAGN82_07455 [Myxococcota bacterium]